MKEKDCPRKRGGSFFVCFRRKLVRPCLIININNHLHNSNICCTFAVANVLRGKGKREGNVYARPANRCNAAVGRHIDNIHT